MFGDESYSQLVGFLKITLPLAALALMSTIFLFARAPSQDSTIPYAEIEEIAREPRLSGAQLSGVTEDGSVIELNARTAKPEGDILTVDDICALGLVTLDRARGRRDDEEITCVTVTDDFPF